MRQSSIIVAALCALSLTACSGTRLLPRETEASPTGFQTYDQVEAAYAAVTAGRTTTAELSKLGFDIKTTPNIEILSSIDVQTKLPHAAHATGQLPVALQSCIDAQDRCTAYLFHPEHVERRHVGNTVLELGGFEHKTVNAGWSAEIVLLIENGVVVYKLMTAKPRIEDTETEVQPLGPLQNVGASITGNQSDGN